MTARPQRGVVFDTGALVAVEHGDRAMAVLLAEARRTAAPIAVPAGCVAQAWRNPPRQARLATLLRQSHVEVVPFDDDARAEPGSCSVRHRRPMWSTPMSRCVPTGCSGPF